MANEIHTDRLILRPLDVKDGPELFAIRSLEEVHKHIFSGPWKSLEAADQWIRDMINRPRSLMYTILIKHQPDGDVVIGVVGLNRWDQVHVMIDPKFSGSGNATEALKRFLTALFELQPKRRSIGTLVSAENVASRKMLENCGFIPDPPQRSREATTTEEPSEQEEEDALRGIGYKHGQDENPLFFLYVKPVEG